MATTPKTPKAPKTPVPLPQKIQDQLTRAVLSKKISKDELETVQQHLTKLMALL